jgi:hypothetical protein
MSQILLPKKKLPSIKSGNFLGGNQFLKEGYSPGTEPQNTTP